MSRWLSGLAGSALLIATAVVPIMARAGVAAAAPPDPTVASVCTNGHLAGSTYTLTANCQTTAPLTIPSGQTLNGGGFTLTATGSGFGAVLSNAGATMTITDLTIKGQFTGGPAATCPQGACLVGIFFNNAGGSVSRVHVQGITLHNGVQVGQGILVRNPTVAQTVNISATSVSGYQKGGLVAQGPSTTVNVSDSAIGPPDHIPAIAQNGVQYGGSITGGSGTISNSTLFGSGGPATGSGTAVLLFRAGRVTLRGNNLTGDGTDVGIFVTANTVGTVIDRNHIARTAPNPQNDTGIGVHVDAGSSATLTCNTFAGWNTNLSGGATQATCQGYWTAAGDGGVFTFGEARFQGSAGGMHLSLPVVGMASAPLGGYWLATSDGRVFNFGVPFFGSLSGVRLNSPIVAIATTGDGAGYYLVAADGGVFTFGDAIFRGSLGHLHLNKPIVGIAATADNRGYWLVASDGGVFTFGDATFRGSLGGMHLNKPIVGIDPVPQDHSYWLVASDGGIFAFHAPFFGSMGGRHLNAPIIGMAATGSGRGYRLVAPDGGVFCFGDAKFLGSQGGTPLRSPMVDMASFPGR